MPANSRIAGTGFDGKGFLDGTVVLFLDVEPNKATTSALMDCAPQGMLRIPC